MEHRPFGQLTPDQVEAVDNAAARALADPDSSVVAAAAALVVLGLVEEERTHRGRRYCAEFDIVFGAHATVVGTDGVPRRVPTAEADADRDRLNRAALADDEGAGGVGHGA